MGFGGAIAHVLKLAQQHFPDPLQDPQDGLFPFSQQYRSFLVLRVWRLGFGLIVASVWPWFGFTLAALFLCART